MCHKLFLQKVSYRFFARLETRLRKLEEARLAKAAYERAERIRKKKEKKASIQIQRIARGKISRNYVNNCLLYTSPSPRD